MKKLLSWALVLCLCLAMLSTAALADGLYTPGTYTGESSGHEAGLTVTVTVDENAITDVSIDVSKETATIGGAAGPALEAQIFEAQGTEIDGVSGATETTDGVVRALSQALAEAQGNTPGSEKAPVQDGTFKGTAPGFGITGQMTLPSSKRPTPPLASGLPMPRSCSFPACSRPSLSVSMPSPAPPPPPTASRTALPARSTRPAARRTSGTLRLRRAPTR